MAKDKEKQLASYYYVEKQKTAKETAVLVGITEATMNKWVNVVICFLFYIFVLQITTR